MLKIGSHVSFNKDTQLLGSVKLALSYNANSFMFYTGAPQNTNRYPINDGLTIEAFKLMKEYNISLDNVIVHAPYIINLAGTDLDKYNFSINFIQNEVNRCHQLGMKYLVIHPGNHLNFGITSGIKQIAKALNNIYFENKEFKILLEMMAGKGTEIGSTIDDIKNILNLIEDKNKIGVCLDTCHLNDSGYDLTNFNSFLEEFDKQIGIDYIKCIHVNDSKNELNTHKDRHENIGYGTIGFDPLINIIYHDKLNNIPKILETPYINDQAPYKEEIEMIRAKEFDHNLKEKFN